MEGEKSPKLIFSKPMVKLLKARTNTLTDMPVAEPQPSYSEQEIEIIIDDDITIKPAPNLLNSEQLMNRILEALENKEGLSIVSVGQTEAFVMAQYTIFPENEFMRHREAYNANRGEKSGFYHRGIRFPNVAARDASVQAAHRADIIAYNTLEPNARKLTEKVFAVYGIVPKDCFEANIRRVFMFSQAEKFIEMLRNRKVLLISSLAPEVKIALEQKYQNKLDLNIVGAISIYEYEEIPRVQEEISKYDFDLCLLGAGINAVILAVHIAETYGKVAFDIGWGMKALLTDQVVTDSFITDVIGLENLFKM